MRKSKNNNAYMREYFKRNPLKNSFHLHNRNRKRIGLDKIDFEEYLQYRDFCEIDSAGKIKSGKSSTILRWEYEKSRRLQLWCF